MSFSSEVKNNLTRIKSTAREEKISEVSGMLRSGGAIKINAKAHASFVFTSENLAVISRFRQFLKTVFLSESEVSTKTVGNLNKVFYVCKLKNEKRSVFILERCGILKFDGNYFVLQNDIPDDIKNSAKNSKAYIRGLFLGAGSISDPKKSYHMEFILHDAEFCNQFKNFLNQFDIKCRVLKRRNKYIVYIKESDGISDILTLMGDFTSSLLIESVKVNKQVRNRINRIVNCENANIGRVVDSATRQIEAIKYIQDTVGLDDLTEELKLTAILRLKNNIATLKELGEMFNPPIGKSAVSHRLKKLEIIADNIKKEKNI